MLQSAWGCRHLLEMEVSFPLAIEPRVGLPDHMAALFKFVRRLRTLFHRGCAGVHSHPPCARVHLSDVSSPEKPELGRCAVGLDVPVASTRTRGRERQDSLEHLYSPDVWSFWRFGCPRRKVACPAVPGHFCRQHLPTSLAKVRLPSALTSQLKSELKS